MDGSQCLTCSWFLKFIEKFQDIFLLDRSVWDFIVGANVVNLGTRCWFSVGLFGW